MKNRSTNQNRIKIEALIPCKKSLIDVKEEAINENYEIVIF